jgi:hypothetical protein
MGLVAAVRAGIAAPEVPAGLLVAVAALVPAGRAAGAEALRRPRLEAAAAWAFWELGPTAPLAATTGAEAEAEAVAAPGLLEELAPLAGATAAAAAAVTSITRAEAAAAARFASSGAQDAASRQPTPETYDDTTHDAGPSAALKATRKEQQHDAPSSAP